MKVCVDSSGEKKMKIRSNFDFLEPKSYKSDQICGMHIRREALQISKIIKKSHKYMKWHPWFLYTSTTWFLYPFGQISMVLWCFEAFVCVFKLLFESKITLRVSKWSPSGDLDIPYKSTKSSKNYRNRWNDIHCSCTLLLHGSCTLSDKYRWFYDALKRFLCF